LYFGKSKNVNYSICGIALIDFLFAENRSPAVNKKSTEKAFTRPHRHMQSFAMLKSPKLLTNRLIYAIINTTLL